jgi:hypothetical protein
VTTSQQIARFITNLDDDQYIGFSVFDKLCDHYNWQGAVFGDLDIKEAFRIEAGRDITETELETIRDDINLYDIICEVAIDHITDVVSRYIAWNLDDEEEEENE